MMQIIRNKTSLSELQEIAKESFGDLVKAVVDIRKKIMVVGGELHADEEAFLLENGSKQEDIWGINIYPYKPKVEWIGFDSMINFRPSVGNFSRGIDNKEIQEKIETIVGSLIKTV